MADTKPGMTTRGTAGKPAAPEAPAMASARHMFGPRPLGTLLPGITRPTYRRQNPASAQLLADWAEIVGPALAAQALPKRLAAGILQIGCPGPLALELQHLAPQLIGRINAHFGQILVRKLNFVQIPARRLPPEPAALPARHAAAARAEAATESLPPGPLKDALQALAQRLFLARP